MRASAEVEAVEPGDAVLLAQVSVAGIVLCAAGTYVAAARGRLSTADELALYLDAAIVALAVLAAWRMRERDG